MRTVLVTGASGFLGRHVARRLARRGNRVVGIGHGCWQREEWTRWGLTEWHNSGVTLDSLQAFGGQPSMLFHCAGSGSVPYSLVNPLQDFERTVLTTAHVMEFVRSLPEPCRVVYPSSASVYGAANRTRLFESDPLTPLSRYGEHKVMAETIVSSYAKQFAVPCALTRLFSMYGPGQRKLLLWDACAKLSRNDYVFFGTGEEVRDWVHVEDAAACLLLAADHASPETPVANVASGTGVSVRDVLSQVACALLGREQEVQFSGTPRAGDPNRYVADIAKANAWQWKPRHNWKEGVRAYAAWWKREAEMEQHIQ